MRQARPALRAIRWHAVEWRRYCLAVVAACCLAGAFPRLSVAGLGWVGPAWMVGAAMGARGGQAFRIGYLTGFVYQLLALHWLLYIPVTLAPVAGWLALACYLALYPAIFNWCIVVLLGPGRSFPAAGWRGGMRELAWAPALARIGWPLAGAILWVGLEMVQARLMSGFPWNLLGASQYRVLPLIQITAFTGVYGLSFLMVWFSLSLVVGVAMLLARPESGWGWVRFLMLPGLAVTVAAAYGSRVLFREEPKGRELSVVMVQPSIPQTVIWDPGENERRFKEMVALSEAAVTNRPALLIWPEAGVPGAFRYNREVYDRVVEFVRRHGQWLIFGANDLEYRQGPANEMESYDAYNSSFLLQPDGSIAGLYHKRRLVIFGEYVPLRRVLPFLKHFTPITGGFATGKVPVAFQMPALEAEVSTLICFEDVFAHFAREHVGPRTDFLINLTNDGWFGHSAAQWQHAANAVFRAIENGVPLVRCTNNGITCLIDAKGRMQTVFRDSNGSVYGTGFMEVAVPLRKERSNGPTFYNRFGDVFGWACVGWSVMVLGLAVLKR